MDARKALRRTIPLLVLGTAATVILRRRLYPRPALPPGPPPLPELATTPELDVPPAQQPLAPPEVAPAPRRLNERIAQRLRQAPIDIVTVVDDLLGASR